MARRHAGLHTKSPPGANSQLFVPLRRFCLSAVKRLFHRQVMAISMEPAQLGTAQCSGSPPPEQRLFSTPSMARMARLPMRQWCKHRMETYTERQRQTWLTQAEKCSG